MSSLALAVPATVAAAACYNLAPVVQAAAARREPATTGLGLRLAWRLARHPRWLAGVSLEVLGFAAEAFALANAPLVLVQPLLAVGVVVLLAGAAVVLGERAGAAVLLVIGLLTAGGALTVLGFVGNDQPLHPAGVGTQLVILACCAVAVGACVAGASRARVQSAAVLLAVASGVAYGAATIYTRQIGLLLRDGDVLHALATPAPYALAASSLTAVTVFQRAVQQGRATITYPVVEATATVIAVVLALTLLDEQAPQGIGRVAFVGGLLLIGAGSLASTRVDIAPPAPRG